MNTMNVAQYNIPFCSNNKCHSHFRLPAWKKSGDVLFRVDCRKIGFGITRSVSCDDSRAVGDGATAADIPSSRVSGGVSEGA